MYRLEVRDEDNKLLTILPMIPKQFKTGSHGYYVNGKIILPDGVLQASLSMPYIGSKPIVETQTPA